jgi:uncharacterized ion transporter superfamily protein YfcC
MAATPSPPAPRQAPDTLLILVLAALLVAVAVAFTAPGKFASVQRSEGSRQVSIELASYQRTGDPAAVPVFAEGGGIGLLNLPFEGLVAGDKFGSAVGIIAFLLVLGGSFGVLMRTGAIDRTLTGFIDRFQHRLVVLIPGLFVLFSLGGAIFGMGEETIPFVLLLVPVFARMGLDAICVVLVTYVATQVGFATSWMNPFSVIVAQGVAGLPPMSGAGLRVAMWATYTAIGAALTLRYALRHRRAPAVVASLAPAPAERASRADVGVMLVLLGTMVWVIYGVTARGYYLPEIAAQFFAMGLAVGLIAWFGRRPGVDANALADAFREGCAQMLPVVLVVALAKSLMLLLGGTDPSQPSVLNTLLYHLAHGLEGLPASVAASLMVVVQSALNFLVPSGSGQAALTMPIMAPLGDLLGVSRQVSVLAFQLGDGLTNLIVPTSATLMGVLGAARIDWLRWARFIASSLLALFALSLLFVVGAVLAGYA